jgi:hypothetical protein
MSGSDGNGDNYVGMPDDDSFNVDPSTLSWMGAHQGTPTWDGSGNWDTSAGQSWWQKLQQDPKTLAQLNALKGGLTTLKPLADPNAAQVAQRFPAIPAVPQATLHPGQGIDALGQYLQALQQRQQQYRAQFLPKTAGLLGG